MQYLKITRVPIKITRTVEPAKVQTISPAKASVKLSVTPQRLNIRSNFAKIKMDNFENLSQMSGGKSAAALSRDFAEYGKSSASQATGDYTDIGNQLADIGRGGASIPDIIKSKMTPDYIPTGIKYVPTQGPKIDWEPATLNIDVEAAQLKKEPEVTKAERQFTPSKAEVKIDQYPSVKIEYLGDPLYVPPSANPEYEETVFDKIISQRQEASKQKPKE